MLPLVSRYLYGYLPLWLTKAGSPKGLPKDADMIHEQMHYHFPYSVSRRFEKVIDLFEEVREEVVNAGGAFADVTSKIMLDSPPGWDNPWYY